MCQSFYFTITLSITLFNFTQKSEIITHTSNLSSFRDILCVAAVSGETLEIELISKSLISSIHVNARGDSHFCFPSSLAFISQAGTPPPLLRHPVLINITLPLLFEKEEVETFIISVNG